LCETVIIKITKYPMRKWIKLVEGLHGGYQEEGDFDPSILGPTGVVEVWHASETKIGSFRPFTHFGSRSAALHRARDLNIIDRGFLYRVSLKIDKSCWVRDSGQDQHPVDGLMEYLETALELPFDDVSNVGNDPDLAAELLARYGYDALVYHNGWEDAGSVSWIGLSPSKMNIISVERITPNMISEAQILEGMIRYFGGFAKEPTREETNRYMMGWCPYFALALHEVYGFPIVELSEHYAIKTPEGSYVDIRGVMTEEQFHDGIRETNERLISSEELISEIEQGTFSCGFYDERDLNKAIWLVKKLSPRF